jgi:hypothetical protein
MRLLRANYVGHEFVLYHDDFQPLKVEVPLTFRHAEVHWGKAEKSFTKIGEEGKIIAWGMLWEKDFRNVEASPPTCEATLTGNAVTISPARPDFEVLEGQGDVCLVTLPSPNSGRFWLLNEVNLTVPSNFVEPWVYDAGGGYIASIPQQLRRHSVNLKPLSLKQKTKSRWAGAGKRLTPTT